MNLVPWALILSFVACRPATPPTLDAGSGVVDAGTPDAGPPPPPELQLNLRATFTDGGSTELPVDSTTPLSVEPASDFVVTTNAALRNYRVRLFDDAERVLPSDDTATDTDGHTEYRLHLAQPLRPGRRYALLVDAQSGPQFGDEFGRSHPDVRVELRTAGERERSPKAGGKRRHSPKGRSARVRAPCPAHV